MAVWWIDGQKLRAFREGRRLSVAGLARQTTIGVESLRRMEQSVADRQPWPLNVAAVATALGVPVEELIAGNVDAFCADLERQRPQS